MVVPAPRVGHLAGLVGQMAAQIVPTLSPATTRQRLAELSGRLVPGYRDLLAAVDSAVTAVALQAHG